MTVIVTDGTDKEYIEYEPGCDLKNVFRGDEKATMSGGEIRPSLMSNLTENVRIVDGLSGYDFVMSMTLPQDIDQSSSVFSKKPTITFNLVFDPGQAQGIPKHGLVTRYDRLRLTDLCFSGIGVAL